MSVSVTRKKVSVQAGKPFGGGHYTLRTNATSYTEGGSGVPSNRPRRRWPSIRLRGMDYSNRSRLQNSPPYRTSFLLLPYSCRVASTQPGSLRCQSVICLGHGHVWGQLRSRQRGCAHGKRVRPSSRRDGAAASDQIFRWHRRWRQRTCCRPPPRARPLPAPWSSFRP